MPAGICTCPVPESKLGGREVMTAEIARKTWASLLLYESSELVKRFVQERSSKTAVGGRLLAAPRPG